MRVPVAIEQDDRISTCQVDALTTSSRGKQKELEGRILIELLDLLTAVVLCYRAIDSTDIPFSQFPGVVFEDVKLGFEL